MIACSLSAGIIGFSGHRTQVKLLTSQGTHLDQPVNCPEEMYLMMKKCWKVEAELRPTAQEIVRDVRNISQSEFMDCAWKPCRGMMQTFWLFFLVTHIHYLEQ